MKLIIISVLSSAISNMNVKAQMVAEVGQSFPF